MSRPRTIVRDGRKKDWLHIDNEVIDMNLGGLADSVYSKLCRHANNETGKAWPGLKKWADDKKFHYRDVSKALKLLIEKNLIEKSGRKGSQGPFIYTVLDVEKKRGIANEETPEGTTEMSDFQSSASDSHNGNPSDCHIGSRTKLKLNKTHENKTKEAGPIGPAQILAAEWCKFIGIEVRDLVPKDWGALGKHIKSKADIVQLKALSSVCWEKMKHDLMYLHSHRASLLPKIKKPKNGRLFYANIDEVLEEERNA